MSSDQPNGPCDELLLSLLLPPVPKAVGEARRAVGSSCPDHVPCCWALILMASEITTNAIRHAGTNFRVELRRTARGFHLAVIDYAAEKVPDRSPAGQDPLATSGRGMAIVDQLATQWGVEQSESSKSVWLAIDCDPEGATSPERQWVEKLPIG